MGRYRPSSGRLTIAVPGGLAEVARDPTRTRTAKGRRRAKERGLRLRQLPAHPPQQAEGPVAPRGRRDAQGAGVKLQRGARADCEAGHDKTRSLGKPNGYVDANSTSNNTCPSQTGGHPLEKCARPGWLVARHVMHPAARQRPRHAGQPLCALRW